MTEIQTRARRIAAELTPDQRAALLGGPDKPAADEAALRQILALGLITPGAALTRLGRLVAEFAQEPAASAQALLSPLLDYDSGLFETLSEEEKREILADPVLAFIEVLKGPQIRAVGSLSREDCARPELVRIFSMGNCGRFAAVLQLLFPGGQIVRLVDRSHYAYRLGDRLYDVLGLLTEGREDMANWTGETEDAAVAELADDDVLDNYSAEAKGPIV
jgi:hypothetical protein